MQTTIRRSQVLVVAAAACLATAPAASTLDGGGHSAWGVFEQLADACWRGPREMSCFEWEQPGIELSQHTLGPDGTQHVRYQRAVETGAISGDDGSRISVSADGTTFREITRSSGQMRVTYQLDGGVLEIMLERRAETAWQTVATEQRTRASLAEVAQAKSSAQVLKQQQRERWGVLADLVGRPFVLPGVSAYLASWIEPGRVLRFAALHADSRGDKVREITLRPQDQALSAVVRYRSLASARWWKRGDPEPVFLLEDGSIYFADPGVRVGQDAAGNLTLQPGKARAARGSFQADAPPTIIPQGTRDAYAAIEESSRISGERHYEAALAAERARAAQARDKSDSGLFGALVGAAVGAYAGSAAGLDGAQTAELMMRGAAATGAGPVADGLARGFAEDSARQQEMQQGLAEARARGAVEGIAQFRAQQAASLTRAPESADDYGTTPSAPRTIASTTPATPDSPGTADSEAGYSGAGASLLIVPPTSSAPVATLPASAAERAGHVGCVIIQEAGEGLRGARLLVSSVATIPRPVPEETVRDNFTADARARYGNVPPALCVTQGSRAGIDDVLAGSIRQHSGKEVVRTGIMPRAN